jgi:beta-lactamase class A
MPSVNQTLREFGFKETRLGRVMLDQAAASRNEENISTPNEMATMFERIYRGQILNRQACDGMLAFLRLVKADLREAIPAHVGVASKPGEVVGVRTETGIVYLNQRPFVISVMGAYLTEPANPVGPIAKLVFEHMQKLAQGNVYGNLGVR